MYQITKLNIHYYCLIVIGILFYNVNQAEADNIFIPYQQKCSKQSLNYNDRVKKEIKATDTEAQSQCVTCNQNQNQQLKQVIAIASSDTATTFDYSKTKDFKKTRKSNIHPACFLASMMQEYPTAFRNYNCKKSNQRNPYRQKIKPCFNKDYVDLTKKAFDKMTDCFGFNSKEKKKLFSLFNHESHFTLNNKSHTAARCYGQITLTTFQEVSRHIYISRNADYIHKRRYHGVVTKKSDIYDDVTRKCPDIEKKAQFLPAIMSKMDKTKPAAPQHLAYERLLGIPKGTTTKLAITCSTVLNPYNCLFYSLYNMRLNMLALENSFKKDYPHKSLDKMFAAHNIDLSKKQGQTIAKIKEDFGFPLNANEVLTFEGKIKDKRTGKVKTKAWVFADEYEAYQTMKKFEYGTPELGTAKIQKVQLFKNTKTYQQAIDEDIKWTILNTAYNGGISVTDKYIRHFMRKQRESVSNNYCSRKQRWAQKLCSTRKNLFNNQSQSIPDFKVAFKKFLQNKYGKLKGDSSIRKNATEVSQFQGKLEDDIDYLKNNQNNLTQHLNKMHKVNSKKKKSPIDKKDIKHFVNFVKNNCP